MTTVQKVTVEKVTLPAYMAKNGNRDGFGVFVYAIRNGQKIKTCVECVADKAAMIKLATARAKKLGVTAVF